MQSLQGSKTLCPHHIPLTSLSAELITATQPLSLRVLFIVIESSNYLLSYSISVILESKATLFFSTIASSCACRSKQNHNLPISGSRNNCYSPAQPCTGYRRHASTPSSFQTNPLIKLLSDEPPDQAPFRRTP